MFRSKRNSLVKRLWKHRVTSNEAPSATETAEDLELKSVIQSMLKRLKENHLEVLIQAVESRGGETMGCVLLPRDDLRLGRRTVSPHVLCCQIWRWPYNDQEYDYVLKRLPGCSSVSDPTSVCCNPYHWSRLIVSDSPPPPYTRFVSERVKLRDESVEEAVSTETGGTPTPFRQNRAVDSLSNGNIGGRIWCHIAYWEQRQRVGRLYTVKEPTVNVFQELPHGDGMCLGVLQQTCTNNSHDNNDTIKRTREKIGLGLTLSQEEDGVWAYNRSEYPIFVNSPTLDIPNSRILTVKKIPPGYSIKIFDYEESEILEETRDTDCQDGPYDPKAIRISFAKGWGPCYSRQVITSCPCWIEILLTVNR